MFQIELVGVATNSASELCAGSIASAEFVVQIFIYLSPDSVLQVS
jgi:hypothetical protein